MPLSVLSQVTDESVCTEDRLRVHSSLTSTQTNSQMRNRLTLLVTHMYYTYSMYKESLAKGRAVYLKINISLLRVLSCFLFLAGFAYVIF